MKKNDIVFILPLLFVVNIASATINCASLKQSVNEKNKFFYQGLVQKVMTENPSAKQVDVSNVLAEKEWLAIFASTQVSDPGIFFFKNKEIVDVWGGVVEQNEKSSVLKWAQGNRIPQALAQCFFEEIVIQ